MATSPDENNAQASVVVDCDVLEASKENIQPLAGGRRVTTLASVLATPHGKRNARDRLAETKRILRAKVDSAIAAEELNDTEDDVGDADDESERDEPLAAYVHLVNWTVEHYPHGHTAESGILELLEEATRVLLHRFNPVSGDEKSAASQFRKRRLAILKSEPRYLKLWLMYAGYVDRPEIIFEYLLANDIGSDLGVFYEEYGMVLERAGRKQRADEIYLLGIARKAEPLDHLKNRHRDFQKRIMTSTLLSPSQSAVNEPALTVPRTVLGGIGSLSSSSSTGTSTQRRPLGPNEDVFSSNSQQLATTSSSRPVPNNGRRLDVFSDDADTDESQASGSGNAWATLPARSERVKENTVKTEKMGGTKLKAGSKEAKRVAESKRMEGQRKTGGKMEVFCDDDEDEPALPPKPSATEKPSGGSKKQAFALFEDFDNASESKAGSSKSASSGKGRNAAFAPFEDVNDDDAYKKSSKHAVPVTPAPKRFEPFEDEDVTTTPAPTSNSINSVSHPPDSVMRLKPSQSGISSEAEALRRDPFKNYTL